MEIKKINLDAFKGWRLLVLKATRSMTLLSHTGGVCSVLCVYGNNSTAVLNVPESEVEFN